MPMLEGNIVIDPLTGNTTVKTGCAGEVFDTMEANQDYGDTPATNPPAYAAARQQIANLALAVAKVIPHIQANAQVSVNTNVTVTSVSGVTPGNGASGPGNGSGTGTGTVS